MKSIDLFCQGEGLSEITQVEIGIESTFADLKTLLIEQFGCPEKALLFIEDDDKPIVEVDFVKDYVTSTGLKIHIHRCEHLNVRVVFNGDIADCQFTPGTTVFRVKHWAAEKEFGMSDEEAGEHVLQISGSHDRPSPGSHIGSLIDDTTDVLSFDLIPDERINGSTKSEA